MWAWSTTKRLGTLANGQGWANEPMQYIEAITIIDSIHDQVEAEEMEAKHPKVGNAAKTLKTV